MMMLNHTLRDRVLLMKDVAFFPTLTRPPDTRENQWRLIKLCYLSKALDVLLAPLKEASRRGVWLTDPSGTQHVRIDTDTDLFRMSRIRVSILTMSMHTFTGCVPTPLLLRRGRARGKGHIVPQGLAQCTSLRKVLGWGG